MTRDELINLGILALMNAERAALKLEPLTGLEQALLNDVEIIRPQIEPVADAFFAALKDATDEMVNACFDEGNGSIKDDWQTMIFASPLAPEGGGT